MGKMYTYPSLDGVKKVLVVKLRHLGDVLLAAPVFTCLKQALPHAEVDAYIWSEAAPMLQGHGAISNLILYDRKWKELPKWKRLRQELSVLRHIRSESYDLVINLTEGDRGALVTWVSGAPLSVGVDPGKRLKRRVFTHLVKQCPNPRHTVEKDLDALRKLGIFPCLEQRRLSLFIPEAARRRAELLSPTEEFVMIHPVSRWGFKCPPPKLVAQIIDQIDEQVVLTGSKKERSYLEKIASLADKEVLNLAGGISLKELGALMQLSKGLITVDSVPLHMASALKVPVVALFGPTSEENWGPWMHPASEVVSKQWACRPCRLDGCGGSKMSDCLWSLSPYEVVSALERVTSAETSGPVCVTGSETDASLLALNSFETKNTE